MKTERIALKAVLIGDRIDLRRIPVEKPLSKSPLSFQVGDHGFAVVFRYGAVVLFSVTADEEVHLLDQVRKCTIGRLDRLETESANLVFRPEGREGLQDDTLYLQDASVERRLVVAEVLARSTVLAFYEKGIGETFDQVQPMAERMQRGVFRRRHTGVLLGHLGAALTSQQRMIGKAQMGDRPDILWDHPELEALYQRLIDEYEIDERHRALRDKLDLVFRTAQTSLDLLQDRRSLRVEWYIVILIVAEIVISLYELWAGHSVPQ